MIKHLGLGGMRSLARPSTNGRSTSSYLPLPCAALFLNLPSPPDSTMTSHPNFDATLRGRIGDDVLQSVYASDQDMYPAPLTFAHLQSWVNACPDLSICFRRDGTSSPIGVVIALPIRRPHWDDLLCGALKETDIDPDVAFPRGRGVAGEEEVGLHVFHIERFPENDVLPSSGARKGGFAEFAVNEVVHRALLKRQWKVVGLSGG